MYLQELFFIYDCREMQINGFGYQLWRRFFEYVREILEFYFNIRFVDFLKLFLKNYFEFYKINVVFDIIFQYEKYFQQILVRIFIIIYVYNFVKMRNIVCLLVKFYNFKYLDKFIKVERIDFFFNLIFRNILKEFILS